MTLCRLLPIWIIFCTVAGTLLGKFAFNDTLSGLLWGSWIGFAPLGLLFLTGLWSTVLAKDHPRCLCGNGRDYKYLGPSSVSVPPTHYDYQCEHCGLRFRHRDGICYYLDSDDHETPYMQNRGFLGWRAARQAS